MSNERILVVDDNPANLKLVSDLLEWYGYRISKSSSPKMRKFPGWCWNPR
jgi:CheY-like chemotaxis protein